MAQAWANHLKPDTIQAYSAGVAPTALDKYAVKVMAEIGIDISSHHSKHIDDLTDIKFDYVFTVCDSAAKNCPSFTGRAEKIIHAPFEDPPQLAKNEKDENQKLNHYRKVRDQIKNFIQNKNF
jgi:arsenate reductase